MLVIQRPTVEAIGEAQGNRQTFAVSPLEPGFGHTLGNSLRRTLLSSIPGAAITQLRFDDALHEFDTIQGVTEDVTDVILNLKDLVLVCHHGNRSLHAARWLEQNGFARVHNLDGGYLTWHDAVRARPASVGVGHSTRGCQKNEVRLP